MEKIAVYPGSFDPPTLGHLDVIKRGLKIFDKIVVLIAESESKKYLFTMEERKRMVAEMTKDIPGVQVDTLTGLLVDYLKRKGLRIVLRGLRVTSDFDYEFQMSSANRLLYPEMETVCIMSDVRYTLISSSLVRDIIANNGNIEKFVTPEVKKMIEEIKNECNSST